MSNATLSRRAFTASLAAAGLTAAALALTGCGNDASQPSTDGNAKTEDKKITVAASPTPHAEILNGPVKEELEKNGWTLEVKEFTDYVLPNTATEDGEVDANYFQHTPYLDSFNEEKGTHLVAVEGMVKEFTDYVLPNTATEDGEVDANYFQHTPYLDSFNEEKGTHLVAVEGIHFEPFALYPGRTAKLEDLSEGAIVAVPNDTSNEARALLLLQDAGLITLAEDAGITATVRDITDNPLNLEIKELEAAAIPRVLEDVDIAAINGNYALDAGLTPDQRLWVEDPEGVGATTYGNVLVVKEGNEDSEKTKALAAALTSDATRDYINNTYDGAVVPVF